MGVLDYNEEEFDNKFLLYFLIGFRENFTKSRTGAAIPHLNKDQFNDLPLPIISRNEQIRITKILDEAFEKLEIAKKNAEKNLKNAKELFESYLQGVFEAGGDDSSSAKATADKWEMKNLVEVCDKIFAGGDKPKEYSKFKTEELTIPIFSNGEKNNGLYGFTNIARVHKPSITISARGTIGYSVIRKEPFFPIIRLITLVPEEELINLKFLYYSIKASNIIGNGTSIPQLTVPAVKKITINFPKSKEEQQKIVKKLDSLSEQAKKLEKIYQQKLENLDELKKSLLQKAFNGEL